MVGGDAAAPRGAGPGARRRRARTPSRRPVGCREPAVKLADQLMMFSALAGVHEALDLARAYDVEADTVLAAVATSTGDSWVTRNWGFFDDVAAAYDAGGGPLPRAALEQDLWDVVAAARDAGTRSRSGGCWRRCWPRGSIPRPGGEELHARRSMTVVDAHHHYWRIGAPPQTPAHDYEPQHLRGEPDTAGVTATVLVQLLLDEPAENEPAARLPALHLPAAGVVAWLPLRDPTAARREPHRIDGMPRLSGVRCLVGREPLDRLAGLDVWRPVRRARRPRSRLGRRGGDDRPGRGRLRARGGRAEAANRRRPPRAPAAGRRAREPWAGGVRALAACSAVALKLSVGIDALDGLG